MLSAGSAHVREAVWTTVSVLNGVCGNGDLTPVTKWLLDNHHAVDEVFGHPCRNLELEV